MQQLSTYLHFGGNCEEAFKYYQKILGGDITMMLPYQGTPAEGEVPGDWKGKIIHANLQLGDKQILGCDSPPQYFSQPQGFSMTLFVDTPAEVDRIFNGLADGGRVRMPLDKTFFAERFGMLTDRFGIPWMVGCNPTAPGS